MHPISSSLLLLFCNSISAILGLQHLTLCTVFVSSFQQIMAEEGPQRKALIININPLFEDMHFKEHKTNKYYPLFRMMT